MCYKPCLRVLWLRIFIYNVWVLLKSITSDYVLQFIFVTQALLEINQTESWVRNILICFVQSVYESEKKFKFDGYVIHECKKKHLIAHFSRYIW